MKRRADPETGKHLAVEFNYVRREFRRRNANDPHPMVRPRRSRRQENANPREAIHNLKYLNWIEQQGRALDALNARRDDHDACWRSTFGRVDRIDARVGDFNERGTARRRAAGRKNSLKVGTVNDRGDISDGMGTMLVIPARFFRKDCTAAAVHSLLARSVDKA